VLGREVAVLLDAITAAGTHVVRFDGSVYASGAYFCRMQVRALDPGEGGTGSFVATKALMLVR
jgi:hypothetical protein